MAGIKRTITILDEDLMEIAGGNKIKGSEVMSATLAYLEENDLFAHNKNHFHPDEAIKACFKEIGVPVKKVMTRGTLLKLFGKDARDAGLVDFI